MLRITTTENAQTVVLRLEGRLEGAWITVLEQCWQGTQAALKGRRLGVDLTGLTFVDAEGKERLKRLRAHNAELFGDGIESRAIVAEIELGQR